MGSIVLNRVRSVPLVSRRRLRPVSAGPSSGRRPPFHGHELAVVFALAVVVSIAMAVAGGPLTAGLFAVAGIAFCIAMVDFGTRGDVAMGVAVLAFAIGLLALFASLGLGDIEITQRAGAS